MLSLVILYFKPIQILTRTIETITIRSVAELPTIDFIKKIPRKKWIRLLFHDAVAHLKTDFGNALAAQLPHALVYIHDVAPMINLEQLIPDEEIVANQDFFEQCGRDYNELAHALIDKLAVMLQVDIHSTDPHRVFIPFYSTDKKQGKLEAWNYYFHGYHCGFKHTLSGQEIEVSIVNGQEFGAFDPYFFIRFILSTKLYRPLPFRFYNEYEDGKRVLQKMVALGKFEQLNLNAREAILVRDRD